MPSFGLRNAPRPFPAGCSRGYFHSRDARTASAWFSHPLCESAAPAPTAASQFRPEASSIDSVLRLCRTALLQGDFLNIGALLAHFFLSNGLYYNIVYFRWKPRISLFRVSVLKLGFHRRSSWGASEPGSRAQPTKSQVWVEHGGCK